MCVCVDRCQQTAELVMLDKKFTPKCKVAVSGERQTERLLRNGWFVVKENDGK